MDTKRENPNEEPEEIGKAHPVEPADGRAPGGEASKGAAADNHGAAQAGIGRGEEPRSR